MYWGWSHSWSHRDGARVKVELTNGLDAIDTLQRLDIKGFLSNLADLTLRLWRCMERIEFKMF